MAVGARRGVLITGAAKRVGAAITRGLARDGWLIALHYNSSAGDAEALARSLNKKALVCFPIQADLSRRDEIDGLIGRAAAALETASAKLTCLINNASPFVYDTVRSLDWDGWDGHIIPGLAAPVFLSKYFAETIAEDEQGLIINMLDQKIEGLNPDFLSYTIAKVGLYGATKTLAMALAPRIRVCGIAPGIMLPGPKQNAAQFEAAWRRTPLGRNATVEEIVLAVQFLIKAQSATGNIIVLDGGENLMRRGRDISFET